MVIQASVPVSPSALPEEGAWWSHGLLNRDDPREQGVQPIGDGVHHALEIGQSTEYEHYDPRPEMHRVGLLLEHGYPRDHATDDQHDYKPVVRVTLGVLQQRNEHTQNADSPQQHRNNVHDPSLFPYGILRTLATLVV